jgi:flagellar protein FlgJ
MKSGMMDSAGGDLGADLLDQQFSVSMSGMPGGLAQMIERQLTRQTTPAAMPAKDSTLQLPSFEPTVKNLPAKGSNQANFVQKHNEAAKAVEKATGLPAGYMIGQAGHETGWGRSEIKNADGSQSFNLFGIKAGAGWTGKTANVTTTEYINGEPRKVVAKFRAYGSYEESFKDYAKLINDSPRYAQAKTQTGSAYAYASGLQKAGYATDPQYAAKLSRAINTTLHLQRAQA